MSFCSIEEKTGYKLACTVYQMTIYTRLAPTSEHREAKYRHMNTVANKTNLQITKGHS